MSKLVEEQQFKKHIESLLSSDETDSAGAASVAAVRSLAHDWAAQVYGGCKLGVCLTDLDTVITDLEAFRTAVTTFAAEYDSGLAAIREFESRVWEGLKATGLTDEQQGPLKQRLQLAFAETYAETA